MEKIRFCNSCEYCKLELNKSGRSYSASCSKEKFGYGQLKTDKVILFAVGGDEKIYVPEWCPKNKEHNVIALEFKTNKLITVEPQKEKFSKLPCHVDWCEIEEGKKYVIPKFSSQKTKVILIKEKKESFIKCNEVINGKIANSVIIINKNDLEKNFIVEQHNF